MLEAQMRVQLAPRIIVDSDIRFGKPVIEGTRVPVEIVIGKLASGMTSEEVADEYGITRVDVLASLRFAGRLVERKRLRNVTAQRSS
jgi:uncharacterized protein (DUF433 family)